jgi:dolichol-phosphate mannosyltransferase
MDTPRTLVVLATYNEIENLPGLSAEILRVLPAADMLVVDDNSPDGSGRWCDEAARSEPRIHCIHRAGKLGLGSATLEGFRYAIERGYEVVITMDADWSHDPRHLPELLSATEHADVAIGSRYVAGGAIEGWPLRRRLMSRWNNALSRRWLGLPVHDSSGAYRAYRIDFLRKSSIEAVQSTGYAYLEELLFRLQQAGARMIEVPITFRERRAGRSKLGLRETAGKLATLLRLMRDQDTRRG